MAELNLEAVFHELVEINKEISSWKGRLDKIRDQVDTLWDDDSVDQIETRLSAIEDKELEDIFRRLKKIEDRYDFQTGSENREIGKKRAWTDYTDEDKKEEIPNPGWEWRGITELRNSFRELWERVEKLEAYREREIEDRQHFGWQCKSLKDLEERVGKLEGKITSLNENIEDIKDQQLFDKNRIDALWEKWDDIELIDRIQRIEEKIDILWDDPQSVIKDLKDTFYTHLSKLHKEEAPAFEGKISNIKINDIELEKKILSLFDLLELFDIYIYENKEFPIKEKLIYIQGILRGNWEHASSAFLSNLSIRIENRIREVLKKENSQQGEEAK